MKSARISPDRHRLFISQLRSASFLQIPEWGEVKSEWKSESLGIFSDEVLIATALLLKRELPFVGKAFGYIPEGPIFGREDFDSGALLKALEDYARQNSIFLLRIGPAIPLRDWNNEVIKSALASEHSTSLLKTPSTREYQFGLNVKRSLQNAGWRELVSESGFSEGQPNFVFQVDLSGKTESDLLEGFNQLWRRNIKKAEKEGVEVFKGDKTHLPLFHEVYVETAKRDKFIPRPLRYFERMWDELNQNDQHLTLFLARWQGKIIAATIAIQVGEHYWYSYGASSAIGREARGSNAIQWAMIRDAKASGATCYDLRGITPTLDPNDPHVGLIQFKVGTGGYARQFLGEWEKPISRFWSLAFATYLRLRK